MSYSDKILSIVFNHLSIYTINVQIFDKNKEDLKEFYYYKFSPLSYLFEK